MKFYLFKVIKIFKNRKKIEKIFFENFFEAEGSRIGS